MMFAWRQWGITARLVAVSVLPAIIMFAAVTLTLYVTSRNEVRRDVAERGQLIATALAQSSQYGLMSGNLASLNTMLQPLLDADHSITCVRILDAAHKLVVERCQAHELQSESSQHDVPIRIESPPEVDLLEPGSAVATNGHSERKAATTARLRTIGHVSVTMSAKPILAARLQTVFASIGLVLATTVISGLIGWRLTSRLRHTLMAVLAALREIRQGRFKIKLDAPQDGELGELQQTIVEMAQNLDVARHELEEQVATRTKELSAAITQIQEGDAERRRLIVHSNAKVEEDRQRIALALHDHLGASLLSVRQEAAALVEMAIALGHTDMQHRANRIASTSEALYASTRNIVKSLRPESIDTLGLRGAVEDLVISFAQAHPHCSFELIAEPALPELRGDTAMSAYRVTQEALTNIVKHARATRATVKLSMTRNQQQLRIEIQDDGKGFDAHTRHRTGLGLIGMRERMVAAGGHLSVSSRPGLGTTISLRMPVSLGN